MTVRPGECASSHRFEGDAHDKLTLYFKEDVMDINKNITAVRRKGAA